MLQLTRVVAPRVAARSLHTARGAALSPAAAAAASPSAGMPVVSARAALAAEAANDIVFPVSARRQAQLAKEQAARDAANAPPAPKKVPISMPRFMQQRETPRVPAPAPKPVRSLVDQTVKVHWKVSRKANGLLPVSFVTSDRHENTKAVLHIDNVSGDVKSFVRELELVAGPLFYVRTNPVGSVVQVHSSPKSEVTPAFTTKIKDWLIAIGV